MMLALDIGNSKTKYGLFSGRTLSSSGIIDDTNFLENLITSHKIRFAAISSVDPDVDNKLKQIVHKHKIDALSIQSTSNFGFSNAYKTINTLGVDRLCGLAGALELIDISDDINLNRERFIITVDCGTATTVNILDGNIFTGGIIMPGMMTMARSLNINTALLPEVVPAGDVPLVGASTIECIKSGIVNATAGLIDRIVRELNLDTHGFQLFLTGGNTQYLSKALKYNCVENPNLVLYGINRVVRIKEK